MRELKLAEIKKHDCQYCYNCYKNGYTEKITKRGYVRFDGEKKLLNLYCEFDKCPYTKDDTKVTFRIFDKQ